MRKRFAWAALLAALFIPQCRAADIQVFPTGPVFQLAGLVWGTSTQPGFNNNYFFVPANVNESVCVFVKNNNTTNPHTFTASISINPDPSNITPSDGTWPIVATGAGFFAATSPGLPAGLGAQISGVSKVSINFSASVTLGGSPETSNVTIIQTTGNCFSGQNFVGSAPATVSATQPILAVSDGLAQGYTTGTNIVNPGANSTILNVNANSGGRSLYFRQVIVSCTAACSLSIQTTTTVGTGCSGVGIGFLKPVAGSPASTATANFTCATTNPNSSGLFATVNLAANTPFVLDVSGAIAPSGSTTGLDIFNITAVTGTINAGIQWYEK